MVDVVDRITRSRMMSGIKGKDTGPEMMVRRALHARGFRFRLHDKRLPGRPDLYFPRYRAVVHVHGCFWHKHECHLFKWPSSRNDFWREKLLANAVRDERNHSQLREIGMKSLVIWECVLKEQSANQLELVINTAADWLCNGRYDAELPDSNIS